MIKKENGFKAFLRNLWKNDDGDAGFYESIAGEPQEIQEALIASRNGNYLKRLEGTYDAGTSSNSASRRKGVVDKVKTKTKIYHNEPEDSIDPKDKKTEREFLDF